MGQFRPDLEIARIDQDYFVSYPAMSEKAYRNFSGVFVLGKTEAKQPHDKLARSHK
jgi:hypothetical protein